MKWFPIVSSVLVHQKRGKMVVCLFSSSGPSIQPMFDTPNMKCTPLCLLESKIMPNKKHECGCGAWGPSLWSFPTACMFPLRLWDASISSAIGTERHSQLKIGIKGPCFFSNQVLKKNLGTEQDGSSWQESTLSSLGPCLLRQCGSSTTSLFTWLWGNSGGAGSHPLIPTYWLCHEVWGWLCSSVAVNMSGCA